MDYLIIKALHLFFVIAWFAGLFYLPRIFVNLAMAGDMVELARLKLMAGKLYRFMTPLGLIALALGLVLWLGYGVSGGWLHAKLTLVAGLIVYHLMCRHFLQVFIADANTRSHTWFRVFNEIPVLILLAVVLLVIVKPF
ncbi:CopD family protein [Rivihabitans pingtungensis]|jgi:putative membrane protein|uniref:Protoporphyrinogen IX oxidase n=1 Tax=Rivihabitans pingtungensis TaxID=1054498 RepID=A0A318KMB6_9NEIS|nr:CopD family protein [Rivihabitans pingtungensis]MCK6436778.1 CopD family protein [Rivihabitans pingtungensis]PXX79174.1 putative membrane protein [Rivihabitans pingtungensis]